jgi:hypothetical protein
MQRNIKSVQKKHNTITEYISVYARCSDHAARVETAVILWPITIEIVLESLHSDGATFGTLVYNTAE